MAERDKNDIRKRLEELRKDNNRKNNIKNTTTCQTNKILTKKTIISHEKSK